MSRVLLIEDDANLAKALLASLKELQLEFSHVTRLEQAKTILRPALSDYHLILLDRTLPDGDGITLCSWLSKKRYKGAVIVLSARGTTEDRVEGLNLGADDYLPKPFSWDELAARIRALQRRLEGKSLAHKETLWTLDPERLQILGPKGWVRLTPLEFKLAERLIQSKGAIISRGELLQNVWGYRFLPETRTVDYFMGRLRKRFEKDPENPVHFLTVRGAGFEFHK